MDLIDVLNWYIDNGLEKMAEHAAIRAEFSYRGPGKFEGEPAYLQYFWDESLNGCGEDVGPGICMEVSEEDRVIWWPELEDEKEICFWESDTGFVNSCSREDLEEMEEEEYGEECDD